MATNNVSDAFAQETGNVLIDSVTYVGLPLWTSQTTTTPLTVTYAFLTTPLVPSDAQDSIDNFAPLNATQQSAVRLIYGTSQSLTGLTFVETADTVGADIVFGNADLPGSSTMALTSFDYAISYSANGSITSLDIKDYVYFDNVEFGDVLANPVPGSLGYETILHEAGHTLGLDDTAYTKTLPSLLDNTDYTVMSYNETATYKANFSVLDVAALQVLYADSGTIRDFGLTPVLSWPGLAAPTTGAMLAGA